MENIQVVLHVQAYNYSTSMVFCPVSGVKTLSGLYLRRGDMGTS